MANSLVVIFYFFVVALFSSVSMAQTVTAEVVGEFPYVYAQPDFDSPVIANLKPGARIQVSKQLIQYNFHRVQLPKGTGYVSSAEIQVLGGKSARSIYRKKNQSSDAGLVDEAKKNKSTKPISALRYQGLIFEMQNYVEDTMSKTRSENITFIGYRVVGNNTIFKGEMSTDLCIMYHVGAPKYYEQITGYSASGGILNAHFTFDTIVPVSHSVMASYGFGPVLRYSHFEVNLKNAAGVGADYFTLDDMTFGALLRVGAGFRVRKVSVRTDVKYFIESKQYASINLSTLYEF